MVDERGTTCPSAIAFIGGPVRRFAALADLSAVLLLWRTALADAAPTKSFAANDFYPRGSRGT